MQKQTTAKDLPGPTRSDLPPAPLMLDSYAGWKLRCTKLGFAGTSCTYQVFLSLKNKGQSDDASSSTRKSSASSKQARCNFLESCVKASEKNQPIVDTDRESATEMSGSEIGQDMEPEWVHEIKEGLKLRGGDLQRIRTFIMKMISNNEEALGRFFKGKSLSSMDEKDILKRVKKAMLSVSEDT